MLIKFDQQGSLFEQLARALKSEILAGRFEANSYLPATREMAAALGVSRNTVIAAYELLRSEQLVAAQAGHRTRVMNDIAAAPVKSSRISIRAQSRFSIRTRRLPPVSLSGLKEGPQYNLQYGDSLTRPQLIASWRRKMVAAAAVGAGPRYPPARGLPSLRAAIAKYLLRRRGVSCSPDDLIIVSGTQQALSVVARTVLDEGQSAVIEEPYYELAQHALLAHGARLTRVRVDAEGLVTADLPTRPPRLIFVTPSHQFPSGAVLSLARRLELLRYASANNCWIFEDDYDGEFQYGERPLPALRSLDVGERVIYSGSFSKTLFPGLRLGYIACPTGLHNDLYMAKALEDLGCSSVEQAALAAFLESRQYENHLRKSLVELSNRRQALLDGLSRHLSEDIDIVDSSSGMHLVAWFKRLSYPGLEQLISHARGRGLGIYPIHPFYQTPPPKPGLILGFAGLSPAQLQTAASLLASCLDNIRRHG
jgi:GntR family transcriptional regulator / MocR family aminotransferase